ncbi:MAG TPA: NHL repeat-containing protein [Nitrospiria bacterium]|nr:NHL repeat-containing protein [Nitrospiria bacterium]
MPALNAALILDPPGGYESGGGLVSVTAGSGRKGFLNGDKETARFDWPTGVAVDRNGNLFVTDYNNNVIRKINPFGWVETFSGRGEAGFTDGPASEAKFHGPDAIALDRVGNLLVADAENYRIRRITPSGQASTLAGSGVQGDLEGPALEAQFVYPTGVAIDRDGNVYVADRGANRIKKISTDGSLVILAGTGKPGLKDGPAYSAEFNDPMTVAVDDEGNVYVADSGSHAIRRIDRGGMVTTIAGSGLPGFRDGMGDRARFNWPTGLAVDPRGNLVVSDSRNNRIRRIKLPEGGVTTLAGRGNAGFGNGPGGWAKFNFPIGVAVDHLGNIYVADTANQMIRNISPGLLRVDSSSALPHR